MFNRFAILLSFLSICVLGAVKPEVFESNEIAGSLCRTIEIAKFILIPVSAITLTVMGIGALDGKVSWKAFFMFAIAIGAFRSVEYFLDFALPNVGMRYGCKCKEFHILGYDNQNRPIIQYLDLNPDCTPKSDSEDDK